MFRSSNFTKILGNSISYLTSIHQVRGFNYIKRQSIVHPAHYVHNKTKISFFHLQNFSTDLNVQYNQPVPINYDNCQCIKWIQLIVLNFGAYARYFDEFRQNRRLFSPFIQWEIVMRLYSSSLSYAIVPFGYMGENGINQFNVEYQKVLEDLKKKAPSDKDALESYEFLETREEKIWQVLLQLGFKIKEYKKISLEDARHFYGDLLSEVRNPENLHELANKLREVGSSARIDEKAKITQIYLFEKQKKVMVKYGFNDDVGWVQIQAALVRHAKDQEIFAMVSLINRELNSMT